MPEGPTPIRVKNRHFCPESLISQIDIFGKVDKSGQIGIATAIAASRTQMSADDFQIFIFKDLWTFLSVWQFAPENSVFCIN